MSALITARKFSYKGYEIAFETRSRGVWSSPGKYLNKSIVQHIAFTNGIIKTPSSVDDGLFEAEPKEFSREPTLQPQRPSITPERVQDVPLSVSNQMSKDVLVIRQSQKDDDLPDTEE